MDSPSGDFSASRESATSQPTQIAPPSVGKAWKRIGLGVGALVSIVGIPVLATVAYKTGWQSIKNTCKVAFGGKLGSEQQNIIRRVSSAAASAKLTPKLELSGSLTLAGQLKDYVAVSQPLGATIQFTDNNGVHNLRIFAVVQDGLVLTKLDAHGNSQQIENDEKRFKFTFDELGKQSGQINILPTPQQQGKIAAKTFSQDLVKATALLVRIKDPTQDRSVLLHDLAKMMTTLTADENRDSADESFNALRSNAYQQCSAEYIRLRPEATKMTWWGDMRNYNDVRDGFAPHKFKEVFLKQVAISQYAGYNDQNVAKERITELMTKQPELAQQMLIDLDQSTLLTDFLQTKRDAVQQWKDDLANVAIPVLDKVPDTLQGRIDLFTQIKAISAQLNVLSGKLKSEKEDWGRFNIAEYSDLVRLLEARQQELSTFINPLLEVDDIDRDEVASVLQPDFDELSDKQSAYFEAKSVAILLNSQAVSYAVFRDLETSIKPSLAELRELTQNPDQILQIDKQKLERACELLSQLGVTFGNYFAIQLLGDNGEQVIQKLLEGENYIGPYQFAIFKKQFRPAQD